MYSSVILDDEEDDVSKVRARKKKKTPHESAISQHGAIAPGY
tara:strand:- start:1689 stop:1814 length:126 start_codon:yes stop_codon:yes gene_type:complete